MTWNPTIIYIKDAGGEEVPVIAYTDGTNFAFARPVLDSTGAIISPATSGKQDIGNTALATIAAAIQAATPAGTNTIGNVTQNDPQATTGTITAADVASTSPSSLISGQTLITGTPTAGSIVVAAVSGCSSFAIELSGTALATAQFEKSMDGGVTWASIGLTGIGTSASVSSLTGAGANANALLHGNAANITHIRVRCTAYTSGTWNVRILPGYGVFSVLAAVTEADGANAALGAKADAAATSDTGSFSLIALFKRGLQALTSIFGTLTAVPGIIPLTVDVTATAGRSFAAKITAAGNVSVTFSDTTTGVYPVSAGLNVFPFSVTKVNSSGTTATGTYENWK